VIEMIELPVLPTTVIGSYPRPKWLKELVKAAKAGRLGKKYLIEGFNDAVVAVVKEQEEVGIDIPSDGEMRRDEMVEYFAERIEGFKFYGPVRVWGTHYFNKPVVVDSLRRTKPIVLDEFKFLMKVTNRRVVKVTITGPYTIADWSFNEYYKSKEELVFELAKIINEEVKELEKAGALFVQIDEPALTTHPKEMEWAVEAINEVTKGVNIKLGLHVCYSDYRVLAPYFDKLKFSQFALEFANRNFRDLTYILRKLGDKEIGLGVIDVHNRKIEDINAVVRAIRKALRVVRPEQIYVNPDCGLKLLSREVAREKLRVMVSAVKVLRRELRRKGIETIELRTKV